MRVLLIRHGLTALSEAHRYQGRLDTPLSQNGRAVLCTSERVPSLVFHSPMLRAAETAQILFPSSEKIAVSDLREMDFGAFEGRGWWEMEQDADYRAWVDSGCASRCPGGESRAAFSERVCAAFAELMERARAQNLSEVVIVAHGGTQMAVLERWGAPRQDYYRWQTPCGSGWELDAAKWSEKLELVREVCFTK